MSTKKIIVLNNIDQLFYQGANFTGQNGWVYGEKSVIPNQNLVVFFYYMICMVSGEKYNFNPNPNSIFMHFLGWGYTSEGGSYLTDELREVEVEIATIPIIDLLQVPIVSDSVCASVMNPNITTANITSDMLCAGSSSSLTPS